MKSVHVEITNEGLYLMDPHGIFEDGILPAEVVLTKKDTALRIAYDIPTYIQNTRATTEFMLIPTKDMLEEGWYTIEVWFGNSSYTLQYLQIQETTNKIIELAKSVNLDAVELKGIYQVTYSNTTSESNVSVILTATALLNASVIAWSVKQYEDSYELFIKLKNTLQLWKD